MPRIARHRDVHPHRARLGIVILILGVLALAGLIWGDREAAEHIVHAVHIWTGVEGE